MSKNSKDPFEGWGLLGAILGGIYGYSLNDNGGEVFGYAIVGYGTGWLVGFVVHTFLAWLIITFILIVALSALQSRLGIFNQNAFNENPPIIELKTNKSLVEVQKEIFLFNHA